MKTNHASARLCLLFIFLGLASPACGPTALPGIPATEIIRTITPSGSLAVTATSAPTLTRTAAVTLAATLTPSPTAGLTPVPGLPSAEPPDVSPGAILSPENAKDVVELAGWGAGYGFDLALGMAQLSPDGKSMIQKEYVADPSQASGEALRTRFWDLPTGRLRLELNQPGRYEFLTFAPDGTRFAIFYGYCHSEQPQPCALEIRSYPANDLLRTINPGFIARAVFSPDGRRMALSTGDGIAIWDLDEGKLVRVLPNPPYFDLLAFSHDGKLLVGSQMMGDGTVRVWRVETGELLLSFSSNPVAAASPNVIAFSPDDSLLALAYGGSVDVLRVSDWSKGPALMWRNTRGITCMVFSPDGRLIASGWEDGIIALADTATGTVRASWDLHSDDTYDYITDLAFSPDGKLLISLSQDNTLRFWGLKKGE